MATSHSSSHLRDPASMRERRSPRPRKRRSMGATRTTGSHAVSRVTPRQPAFPSSSEPTVARVGAQLACVPSQRGTARLYWNGVHVSEQFARYATRIEQGEDLPPFRGEVLARRRRDFRWNLSGHRSRRVGGDRWSLAQHVAVAGLALATVLAALIPPRARPPAPTRSALPPLLAPIWERAPAEQAGVRAPPPSPAPRTLAPSRPAPAPASTTLGDEQAAGRVDPHVNAPEPARDTRPTPEPPASAAREPLRAPPARDVGRHPPESSLFVEEAPF